MHDSAFMIIRVGKHREKILAADYKPANWPEGHEIIEGVPPIPVEVASVAENLPADSVGEVSGVSTASGAETPASGPESDDMDALKAKADALGVEYGHNIGASTLAKRIADAEGGPQ